MILLNYVEVCRIIRKKIFLTHFKMFFCDLYLIDKLLDFED